MICLHCSQRLNRNQGSCKISVNYQDWLNRPKPEERSEDHRTCVPQIPCEHVHEILKDSVRDREVLIHRVGLQTNNQRVPRSTNRIEARPHWGKDWEPKQVGIVITNNNLTVAQHTSADGGPGPLVPLEEPSLVESLLALTSDGIQAQFNPSPIIDRFSLCYLKFCVHDKILLFRHTSQDYPFSGSHVIENSDGVVCDSRLHRLV